MKAKKAIKALRAGKLITHKRWHKNAKPLGFDDFDEFSEWVDGFDNYKKGWKLYNPETIRHAVWDDEYEKLHFEERPCKNVEISGYPFPCGVHRTGKKQWKVSCKVTGARLSSTFGKKEAIRIADERVSQTSPEKIQELVGAALISLYKHTDGVTIETK